MKDKDILKLDLNEVLAEIETFLEARSESQESNMASVLTPVRLSSTSQCQMPRNLGVTQFYLSRHSDAKQELLQALPGDAFIIC
jgi:hypothetical protein